MRIQALQAQLLTDPSAAKVAELVELATPWNAASNSGDALDLIARWFILYKPEKLSAKGVNVDGLKRK